MSDYLRLMGHVAPVFIMMTVGWGARRVRWLNREADDSILKLVVNVLYPCLVFDTVLQNPLLRNPENLLFPPLVGFAAVVLGFAVAYQAGKAIGLVEGRGLRTFAFAVGIFNYGYIPIPIITALFGRETLGVMFLHNVGVELAMWTVGILLLTAAPWREGMRKVVNPPVISLAVALAVNLLGWGDLMPAAGRTVIGALGACAIPLGLLLTGATLEEFLENPKSMFEPRIVISSSLLRLGLLPIAFLVLARLLPFSIELKQVMVVEAAMPAAVIPIVLARHYGGQPLTAVQVVAGTTAIGLLSIPLWIRFGLNFVGV